MSLVPRKKILVTGDETTAEVLIVALDVTDPFDPARAATLARVAVRRRWCDVHIVGVDTAIPRVVGFVINQDARSVHVAIAASFDCNWITGMDPRGRFLALGEW